MISHTPLWLSLPFVSLLLMIAAMPLSGARLKHWWEHRYPAVSIGLGLLVSLVYLLAMPHGLHRVGETLGEYASFICLIGSLFVVAGGILIHVKGEFTPTSNVVFLFIGAVLANFIGTTGASMVLIRPYIRANKIRISGYHVVFFIFVVSNCGGALTPIGDPPLFLGYLRGVPFFWLVEHVLPVWLLVIGLVLLVFYFIDRRNFLRMPRRIQVEVEAPETWRFEGGVNILLLAALIGAVFLPDRYFLRELSMLLIAGASLRLTPKPVHDANHFGFGPIREVALLFFGIFLTMMPALGFLQENGRSIGVDRPAQYYFASGALSSVLDNAPTYLNFLQLAQASCTDGASVESLTVPELLAHPRGALFVVAVSLGSVFFGAMTYIGNGPNFMVKAIAESSHVHMPGFLGYIFKFSLPFLLPVLLLAGLLIFH